MNVSINDIGSNNVGTKLNKNILKELWTTMENII